jgi:methylated-DNA-[protein]-cysteine S-methyltransferase
VKSINFDLDNQYAEKQTDSELGFQIKRYFGGEEVRWNPKLDLEGISEFTRRVYERVSRIPYGQVCTYGEVAGGAGSIGGARAVGQIMARNRFPLIIPCHRVISSGMSIGGFSSGIDLKRYLLRLEGIDL